MVHTLGDGVTHHHWEGDPSCLRCNPSGLGLPYKPKTRQEQGGVTEKRVLKERGARQHPRSGAGRIKEDGSTPDTLIEVKDANKTYTLSGEDLLVTYTRAIRQGKEGRWVITFANGIEAEIHLTRRHQ